jgi:monoamine oxidase
VKSSKKAKNNRIKLFMKLNRRQFIGLSSLALLSRPLFAQNKPRVIVAGAGLSGLSAAFELSNRGYEVTVIEARNRIGGRIQTLRKPFVDGQFVETGGEILGDGYQRFLKYADKFGIKYEEQRNETQTGGSISNLQKGIGTSVFLQGKLYPQGSDFPNPYNFFGEEAINLPTNYYIKKLLEITAEVRATPSKLNDYDKISLAEAMRQKGVSAQMIKLMDVSLNYNSIETVSTGGILWEGRRRANIGTKAVEVVGGNDQITKALFENSQKNGVKYVLEAKIKEISHTENSVKVSFQDKKGKTNTLEAEKLVCTIPFSVLRNVKFSPALSDAKMKAINELAYTQITKVFLQGKRENWDQQNLGSMIWTDTPCERIFNAAGKRGDKSGIFTIWTEGEGAKIPDSLSDKKRIERTKKEFAKILPMMKFDKSATKSWGNDEFVRGAYSHFTVGQLVALQPFIKTQVGTIHFAGEHTAEKAPGMEGALESAERVIWEIATSKK